MHLERANIALPDVIDSFYERDHGARSGASLSSCPVTRGCPTKMTRASFEKMCGLKYEEHAATGNLLRHTRCGECRRNARPAELRFIDLRTYFA